uniref:Uncharacterized protein n=1 Tax=Arundo donax TaxID=35708 RepID=A0A0A9CHU1_ARUDO
MLIKHKYQARNKILRTFRTISGYNISRLD